MKTTFRSSIIILILFTFTGLSFASGDTVSREEFMKVINELKTQREQDSNTIKKLSEEIETLKNTKGTIADNSDIEILKEDVEELSELMETVERKTLLDRVKVTGDLRTRMDWFDYKNDATNHEEEVHALGSTRFRLLLKSDIAENLKFTGRLAMHKNWNDSDYNLGSSSFSRSRARTDEDLKVERAYVDYFFSLHEKLPMALTFGRLPNTDGLPTNLHEDTPRRSTFPGLAYDNEGDGVALSVNLDKLTGLPGSALRVLYLRTNVDNIDDVDTTNDEIYYNNEYHFKDAQSFIVQLETGFPGKLSGTTFMLNFLMLNPFANINPQPWIDAGLTAGDYPNQLGDICKLTAYIQSERAGLGKLDRCISGKTALS